MNNQNNQNPVYANYEGPFSPNYNEYKDIPNFKTPQVNIKTESSQNILNQTKASLNNLLSNLKKGSNINDMIMENKKKKLVSTMSNLSHISNKKYPEDGQELVESYIKLSKIYDNNNIKTNNNNLFNYNQINIF